MIDIITIVGIILFGICLVIIGVSITFMIKINIIKKQAIKSLKTGLNLFRNVTDNSEIANIESLNENEDKFDSIKFEPYIEEIPEKKKWKIKLPIQLMKK